MSRPLQAAAVAVLCGVTWAALFASQGHPAISLAPLLLAAGGLALAVSPLRIPAAALLLAALAADIPQERPSAGLFKSPLYPVGFALFENLHKVTGAQALRFSLADALLVALLALAGWRALRGDREGIARPEPASLVGAACGIAVLGTLAAWAWGLARGGDLRNSLWQVRPILFAPLLALLFARTFRGEDGRALVARIVVAAALVKAAIGFFVYFAIARPQGLRPAYVTSHADSLLYASAITMALLLWFEERTRRTWALLLGFVPILLAALYVNNRRLGWVCLAGSLLLAAIQLPASALRRRLFTAVVVSIPLALGYVAAGWGSTARPFAPVKVLKSILDRKDDRSSQTRDIENYNLTRTMRVVPFVGTGFGHEYREEVVADSIRGIFAQYLFIPHNSLLGLYAFAGLAGGWAVTAPLLAGLFLAFRARRFARSGRDRVAATTAAGALLSWLLLAWGDMALQSVESTFVYASAIAVVGGLAVETGAWPASRPAALEATPSEATA